MLKVTRATRLAEANWHIAKTRECIARQKALVEAMKREKRGVSRARSVVGAGAAADAGSPQVHRVGVQCLATKVNLEQPVLPAVEGTSIPWSRWALT
jgi:hypothetical protein